MKLKNLLFAFFCEIFAKNILKFKIKTSKGLIKNHVTFEVEGGQIFCFDVRFYKRKPVQIPLGRVEVRKFKILAPRAGQ